MHGACTERARTLPRPLPGGVPLWLHRRPLERTDSRGVPSPWATATGQLLARFPSAVQLGEAVGGQLGSRAHARTQARVTRVQGGSWDLAPRVPAWQAGAMEPMPWDKYLDGAQFSLRTHDVIMRCAAGRFILTEHPERAPRDVPSVTPDELRTLSRSLGAGKALDPQSIKLILESKRVLGGTVVNKEDDLHAQAQEQRSAAGDLHSVRAQGLPDDRGPAFLLTAQQGARARSSGAPKGNAGSTQQSQLFS